MLVKKNAGDAYLKLFSSIKLTKGHKQSLLADFDRNEMHIIPNDLYDFIEKCKDKPFVEVKKEYGAENRQAIREYVNFLEKNEYIIFTNRPNRFQEINLKWKSPNYISNAVVDIDAKSNHDYIYIVKMLDDLGCQALDVRAFNTVSFKEVVKLLYATKDCRPKSLRLLLPYTMFKKNISYNKLLMKYQRLETIIFHGSPKQRCEIAGSLQSLLFSTNKVHSPGCCGYVSEKLMICNLRLFSEAQKHNSCLNKKLSIDVNGLIKNCAAMQNNFGHYKKVDMKKTILTNRQFTAYWKINKNDILDCKNCEFKYVCVDCRANIEDVNNILSKPSHCCYNPYTAQWED